MAFDIRYFKNLMETIESSAAILTNEAVSLDSNPTEIAKHLKINAERNRINVEFNLPVEQTVGKKCFVRNINMEIDLLHMNRSNLSELSLWYEVSVDTTEDGYERIMRWFDDGNYNKRLNAHLRKAGFSAAAATVDDIFAVADEEINYDAPGIAKEIADTATLLLKQHPTELVSRFGPPILLLNIEYSPADIEPVKHDVIKHILTDIKDSGRNDTVDQLVNKLINIGVQWPELASIKRSLDKQQVSK